MFGWGGGAPGWGGPGRPDRRHRGGYGYDSNMGESRIPEYRPDNIGATPIEEMARVNGWSVAATLPAGSDGQPISFDGGPFAPRQYGASAPIVAGQAGYWPFVACTVQAKTRAGDYWPYAVTAMQFPGALPYVHIYPESWRATVTSVTPEVNLESSEFNDRFSVFSDSARTVYQLISPRAMRYLIELPPRDELWTAGNSLCICRVDRHSADVLGSHLTTLTTLAGDIPSSAWDRR